MPDQGREAMSDIISAKCFGCGHVVKVPSALGGKKARCPKCTNTIVIPALAETSDEIVTDDQLPEVARDGEILDADGEVLEGELVEPEPPPVTPSRERSSTSHRRVSVKESPSGRGGARGGPGRAPKPSNTGVVIGVVVVLLVVAGVGVGLAMRPSNTPPSKAGKKDAPDKSTTDSGARTAEDDALEARCREYVNVFNRGQVAQAARFYDPEPGRELQQGVARLMGGPTQYKGPEFKKSSAAEGVTIFVCEFVSGDAPPVGKEITLRWKKVGEEWFIADRP